MSEQPAKLNDVENAQKTDPQISELRILLEEILFKHVPKPPYVQGFRVTKNDGTFQVEIAPTLASGIEDSLPASFAGTTISYSFIDYWVGLPQL